MTQRAVTDQTSSVERRRDDAVVALVCACLAAMAAIVWSTGLTVHDDAAALAAAPVCTATVTSACRTISTATVTDRTTDSVGREHLSLSDNSTVVLASGTGSPIASGAHVTLTSWKGAVTSVASDGVDALQTTASPAVAVSSNDALVGAMVGLMGVLALVALGPRLVHIRPRRRVPDTAPAAAAPHMRLNDNASFALRQAVITAGSGNGPRGVVQPSPTSSGAPLNPIRSSSGAPVNRAASAPSADPDYEGSADQPAAAPAAAGLAGVVKTTDGFSFAPLPQPQSAAPAQRAALVFDALPSESQSASSGPGVEGVSLNPLPPRPAPSPPEGGGSA